MTDQARKPLSSEFMKPRSIFSITLAEDDTGFVYAMADHAGEGQMALEVGMEIMHHLAMAEKENPLILAVQPFIVANQKVQ